MAAKVEDQSSPDLPVDVEPGSSEDYPPSISLILQKKGTGDIDDVEVAQVIEYMTSTDGTNWGEIEDVETLYEVADKASNFLGGIPDCFLKPALMNVLTLQVKTLDNGWMRNHLTRLQKLWKTEMSNEHHFARPTKAVLESRSIESFVDDGKPGKPKSKKRKQALHQLGISGILSVARKELCIGNNRHEIDDEDGVFKVDGEPLTFDSWMRMTEGEAHEIAACRNKDRFSSVPRPTPTVEPELYRPPKQELEEGEISDSDFPSNLKTKKKKRPLHTFDSDSSESDDDFAIDRKAVKRARARKDLRNGAAVNTERMRQRFNKIYQYRYELVDYLSVQQRVQMLHSLKMALKSSHKYDEIMASNMGLASILTE
ncbi:hypothetical protein FO519_002106 [Halicephalobus sp. NKZ332]|nr:hypothetical protein FO519_002106 [Halicephalobus sp. NKZ332]